MPQNVTSGIATVTSAGTGLAVNSNVQYKDVTLQLEVVPLINSANEVTLDIFQKIDSVVPNGSVNIAGTNVPVISTRRLRSTVSVPNNGVIVLGGLITQEQSLGTNRVPLLGRIPVLNTLFKSHTNDNNRDELVIFLHPVVANTPCQLDNVRKTEEGMMYMEPGLNDQLKPIPKAVPVAPKCW